MKDDANLTDRVGQLEFQLAHLQRDYDQLNEVVTQQSLANQRLESKVAALELQLKQLKEKPQQAIDPLDEKPPHY